MQEIAKLHHIAMGYADQAEHARLLGNYDSALAFSLQAFEHEKQAAQLLKNKYDLEPTRSVLFRSAATLALECKKTREAERLIASALVGDPPSEIAEELRDLLENVNLQRHLDTRGISLQENEFQMSMQGDAVGFGVAPTYSVINRVKDLETMIYRTVERFMGRKFKEAGRREKRLADSVALFMSVPRASSFSMTFRLGQSRQLSLFEENLPKDIIEDVFDCMDFIAQGDINSLKQRIPDQSYFKNFLALTKKIAPDGKKIRVIGFTKQGSSGERRVALTRKRNQIDTETDNIKRDSDFIDIRGKLLSADATKKNIGTVVVIDQELIPHHIVVPRGMMSDIVKPMFEEYVHVIACRKKSRIVLVDIEPGQE